MVLCWTLCGVRLEECKYITDINPLLHVIDVGAVLCKDGLMNIEQIASFAEASVNELVAKHILILLCLGTTF